MTDLEKFVLDYCCDLQMISVYFIAITEIDAKESGGLFDYRVVIMVRPCALYGLGMANLRSLQFLCCLKSPYVVSVFRFCLLWSMCGC